MLVNKRGSRRYASDELQFTGIDLGGGRSRSKYADQHSDDSDLSENDSQATTDNETEDDVQAELEDALVQSALARIRKARAKGKQDVKLNKGEVAALERRRKRLQLEADGAARRKETERKRGREKEERVAVSLSHFDSSSTTHSQAQGQPGPPVGMFPSPNASQSRPRSSASSQRSSSQRHGSSSPFDYQYVAAPSNRRQALPYEEERRSQSHLELDPFQYQMGGSHASYSTGVTTHEPLSYAETRATTRRGSGEISPNEERRGSGDHGDNLRVGRRTSREEVIVVEAAPQPEKMHTRSKGKKTTSRTTSPGKRSGATRRRKDK
ncbi:hypothetical protein F4777DRAFT_581868 [Nemania sp. FL0916]|nr:hypothetical protein F4777DRAFT_581868 [Nemania sp. FL0916]